MIIKCPECGHQVSDRARTCPSCGIDIAGKVTRCPDCGDVIFKYQAECPNCHCAINEAATVEQSSIAVEQQQQRTAPRHTPMPDKPIPVAPPAQPKTKQKKSSIWSAVIVAFVIALIIVLVGIYFYQNTQQQNEMKAYENAMLSNEPAVLQSYLDMYTTAPIAHRDSIESHLKELKKIDLDWANAVVSGSKAELEQYIKLHPDNVHVPEAKLKIDSLDWIAAQQENTSEAYQRYMENHNDGEYYDEAKNEYDRLEAKKVTLADKDMITRLFTEYFKALSERNETSLTSTLANILTSFLHKENATKSDVIQYMHKLYEAIDIQSINFVPNNDWKIDKTELDDGSFEYAVTFSVDERIDRTDAAKEHFCTYKVSAKVTTDGKIENLNMKKIIQ